MKTPIQVLVAPNAMKESLTAREFANAIASGLAKSESNFEIECCPIADGGDGTFEILANALDAETRKETASDPLGRLREVSFGWSASTKTAIIEMAETSGMHLLTKEELNPLVACTTGLGTIIKKAIQKLGAKKILLGIGGSATVDCGFGMAKELGIRFLDKENNEVKNYADILDVAEFDDTGLQELFASTEITILSDVKNKLLGAQGAAYVFGPQKGACPWKLEILENRNSQMAQLFHATLGNETHEQQGTGAAGGVAFPLLALLPTKCKLVPGIEFVFETLAIEEKIKTNDIVITGEGCIDEQSFYGKAVGEVAMLAHKHNKPTIALCGKMQEPLPRSIVSEIFSINPQNSNLEDQIANAFENCVTFASTLDKTIAKLAK